MYVRPPSSSRHSVRLPDNYSGNAFNRQSPYAEMPPPTRTQAVRQDAFSSVSPSRELDLPEETAQVGLVRQDHYEEASQTDQSRDGEKAVSASPSVFSSLLPKANFASHFPFGHGIGSEEILILAVMLMVFLSGNESGEVDSEFILLLGLLLFAG